MNKDKNIRINRLSVPTPEHRLDDMRAMLEFHDLPMILGTMLKYMPEEQYKLMVEDLKCTQEVLMESRAIFEEGGLPGRGALKILVGKGPEQNLDDAECAKIGKIIASMRGEPKKYYVGMTNFLGAACRIHNQIKTSYMEAVRLQANGDTHREDVPAVVNRMFAGKTMPTEEEIKKRQDEEVQRLKELNKKTEEKIQSTEEPEKTTEQPEAKPQPQPQETQPEAKPQPEVKSSQPDVSAQTIRYFRNQKAGAKPEEPQKEEEKPEEPAQKPRVFKQYIQPLKTAKFLTRNGD